jgi:hypothetical protein
MDFTNIDCANIDPNLGMEHNIEREKRLTKHVTDAAKQIIGAKLEKIPEVSTDLNLFILSFPEGTEINKIAMHFVYRAAYACDKYVVKSDGKGSSQFLFYIDMASPYV